MKSDLVHNACLAMPMLLALWSDFQLQTHHLDTFMAMLIQFGFAYILAGADVEQVAMKMLHNTLCFEDEQSAVPVDLLTKPCDVPSTDGSTVCSAKCIVSYLLSVNAKLLVPWLLSDERPHDLCSVWPADGHFR